MSRNLILLLGASSDIGINIAILMEIQLKMRFKLSYVSSIDEFYKI